MKLIDSRSFKNGNVYALRLADGMMVETTETFLPYYTKDCINEHTNQLKDGDLGSRKERWMIGVSCMSGCPCRCKFCATGSMPKWRNLTADEIVDQVLFAIEAAGKEPIDPFMAREFKINYTRMGEPFLNIEAVKRAIEMIERLWPRTHHYISTIGIKDSDFRWIQDNITLQVSLHSCNDARRNELIPFPRKMTIPELGAIRTLSRLKTTLNMTLLDDDDFDIGILKEHFHREHFFVKLSPINPNEFSKRNGLGNGAIEAVDIL
jgi:23S rRNA (adenine2503-C2)-methyltransferase